MIEQINYIQDKNDFIQFVRKLSLDFKEHNEEWDKPDFQMFAKMLYMGKI